MNYLQLYKMYPNVVRTTDGIAYDKDGNVVDIDVTVLEKSDDDYKWQRAPEYPPIQDQLDDLFHCGAFSPAMRAKIQAVKDKYPKKVAE